MGVRHEKAQDDKRDDQENFSHGKQVLKMAAESHIRQMHQGEEHNDGHGDDRLVDAWEDGAGVFTERDGRQSDGSRKSGHHGDPSRQKADGGMVNLGEIGVLAAGPGHHRPQFPIAQGPAKGAHTPQNPQHENRKGRVQAGDLEAQGGEHADPDHIGNDNDGGGEKGYRPFLIGSGWDSGLSLFSHRVVYLAAHTT